MNRTAVWRSLVFYMFSALAAEVIVQAFLRAFIRASWHGALLLADDRAGRRSKA
jgi:hypothetical protein